MNLTFKEVFLLWRRRAGLTWAQARRKRNKTPVLATPLTTGERCYVLRRRQGMTQRGLAQEMKVSRIWIIQMEHDRVNNDALRAYWGTVYAQDN